MRLKKTNFIKKTKKKKIKTIMVNLTNLLPEIWDRDNSIKKKSATNNQVNKLRP
jgi:hypothetical protein